MRRPGLAVLESLSALAVEGRQEALLADAAVHIRDNRIPGATVERTRRGRFRSVGEGGCLLGDALADAGTAVRRPTTLRRHDLQGADHPLRPQSTRIHRRVPRSRRHQDITEPAGIVHRDNRAAQQQREHAQSAARHYGRHRRDQGEKAGSALIVLVHASQVRLKMYKTPSRERVCEIQPLEGDGSSTTQKYIQHQKRRFSEFSASVAASTSALRRRASEMTRPHSEIEIPGMPTAGITCSNTDLISILSSLTSSATEINTCGTSDASGAKDEQKSSWSAKTAEQRRSRLKSSRSNSFDVSILHSTKCKTPTSSSKSAIGAFMTPSTWFVKRHQPISKKSRYDEESAPMFKLDKAQVVKTVKDTLAKNVGTKHKVLWDDSSGTKVDAQVLGNAIEKILTSTHRGSDAEASGSSSGKPSVSPNKSRASKVAGWFTSGNKEPEQPDCDSICSTLKDLFVK
ncbi:PREDICTED: uncharacterized protein LOC105561796 isoform X2 [Vollenhovia emeryi]|uniref:uncharacterized protein LOC105561796 isoform X2 n=1 Tax=Vollenhovia emeryi TaxID=411798 RepID=UPI0005F380AF|nr:PREDICTED: uncharacterized protein LOC105561796 isoform X2 [Vollenhovia emeryi]